MDTPTDDIQYARDLGEVAAEPSKKRKAGRKKPDAKQSKAEKEEPLYIMPEVKEPDYDTDLLNHTTKLESELAAKKKKLKLQRKKFRELLHSLAKYIDGKGIDHKAVDEFIRGVRPQLSRNIDQEYESFYSSHKCLIVDPASFTNQNGHTQDSKAGATKKPKTVQKTGSPMSSTVPLDKNTIGSEIPALDLTQQDPSGDIFVPQLQVSKEQKPPKESKPRAKKEKDPEAKAAKKAEEGEKEKKPRKPRKPKDKEEAKEPINLVDLEEISPKINRMTAQDYMGGMRDNGDGSGLVIPKLNAGIEDKMLMRQPNELDLMSSYLMGGIPGLHPTQGLQGMGSLGLPEFPGLQNNILAGLPGYGALGNMGGTDMDAILSNAVQELMKSLQRQKGQGGHDNRDYYMQRGGYN